jgi:hypothetical protein
LACPGAACLTDGGARADAGAPAADSGAGQRCGDKTCTASQVCCIDCDGKGACGSPGTACPGFACPARDAGSGPSCGDLRCGPGQTCCGYCPGPTHYCGPVGSDCPQVVSCPDGGAGCGTQGQPCCQLTQGDPPCSAGLTCCSGVPYPEHGACLPKCELKSDRAAKRDVRAVDANALLERLAALPISTWRYAREREARHVGPMAQDFKAAFAVGSSDQRIDLVDANGVALAAIQALYRRVRELERELAAARCAAASGSRR